MGMLENLFEHSLPGVVVGAVASAILLPRLGGRGAGSAQAGSNGRSGANRLMKTAVRGYVTVTDRVKELTAETREQLRDLAAEVRAERQQQRQAEETAKPEIPASGRV